MRAAGIGVVLGVGELAGRGAPDEWAATAAAAVERARARLRPGDAVLVKGSRAVGPDVADALAERLRCRDARPRAALVALIISLIVGANSSSSCAQRVRPAHPRGGPAAPLAKQGLDLGGL